MIFYDIFRSNLIKRDLKSKNGFAAFSYSLFMYSCVAFMIFNALKNLCYSKEK